MENDTSMRGNREFISTVEHMMFLTEDINVVFKASMYFFCPFIL